MRPTQSINKNCFSLILHLFFSLFLPIQQNELAILEFIHSLVETMDKYFESVCELDIMFHIEKAHYIVNEMVSNGVIVDNNKVNILRPLQLMDQIADKQHPCWSTGIIGKLTFDDGRFTVSCLYMLIVLYFEQSTFPILMICPYYLSIIGPPPLL